MPELGGNSITSGDSGPVDRLSAHNVLATDKLANGSQDVNKKAPRISASGLKASWKSVSNNYYSIELVDEQIFVDIINSVDKIS